MTRIFIQSLFILAMPIFLYAQVEQRIYDVQRIIKLTKTAGKVLYLPVGRTTFIPAKPGQTFPAGTIFKTKERSVGEFEFLLKGKVQMAPNSILRVEVTFEKRLMLWQLDGSSKIDFPGKPHWVATENGIGLTQNSKLHLLANKKSSRSGVLVYKGYVNLYRVDPAVFKIESLFKIKEVAFLDGLKRVQVGKGEYSYYDNKDEATMPVRISPLQFEILSDVDLEKWIHTSRKLRLIRTFDRLPEGVFSKQFNIEPPSLKNKVKEAARGNSLEVLKARGLYAAEGQFLIKTNDYRPPAGGYIDFKTAVYVAPQDGSDYDPNMNVYIPSAFLGTINVKNGEYIAPLGYEVSYKGMFIPDRSLDDPRKTPRKNLIYKNAAVAWGTMLKEEPMIKGLRKLRLTQRALYQKKKTSRKR